jgi:membrane protein
VTNTSRTGLTYTATASIIAALWSASAGTKALMTGIDIAYDTPEDRPFLLQRAMALGITVGLIAFVAVAASAATFLPGLLDAVGADQLIRFVQYGRWPIIFVMVIVGLGVLFKVAPCRPAAKSPWISVGSVIVAVLWVLATLGLSLYSTVVGDLGAAYGALSGLIVMMLWFFISGLIVLFGAEVNAELEKRNLARPNFRNGRSHR